MKFKKTASKDFLKNDLPSNRVEVFWDVIRNRWKTLLGLGMLCFLFALPLLIVVSVDNIISVQVMGEYQSGIIDRERITDYLKITNSIAGVLKVVGYGIFSLAIAGVLRIIKRLIWAEGIDFKYDFAMGIRENGKKMFLLFLIAGVMTVTEDVAPYILNDIPELSDTGYTAVRSILTATNILALLPLGAFVFSQIAFYENKLSIMIKNSIAFLGNTLTHTYGLLFLIYLPYKIILHFCGLATQMMIYSLSCIILLPLVILIWLLYSSAVFDKFVNRRFYPEIVDKGIWRKQKE